MLESVYLFTLLLIHCISNKITAFGKYVMQELNLKSQLFKSDFICFLSLQIIIPYNGRWWNFCWVFFLILLFFFF